ncbi:annexin-2 receptor [Peromyscus maniculatus bairdii]|uniref:annexin-2 receptor n=1 Tax=Peromyscus maniculatus bairdii TaxID=230844 RepID=UPI00077DB3B3
MEPTFWSVHVKQAWDSAPVAPETEPLLPVFSEERGPWPLPFYPVLGGIRSDRGDDLEQPLPCLQGDLSGSDGRTESSSEPDSPRAFHEGRGRPATPASVEDSDLEPVPEAEQPRPWSRTPHRGRESRDTETTERRSPGECEPPTTGDRNRGPRVWTAIGQRILSVFRCCMPRGCCIRLHGSREP